VSFAEARWYVWLFLGVFLPGIGIPPLPEELAISVNAGVVAVNPEVRWYIAWPTTIAGIVCADAILYWFGRLCGPQLFERRWVRKVLHPERLTRLQGGFGQHGFKILLTARLLPPIRAGAFILAGAIKYPFLRFLVADGVYAVFGVGVVFFGSAWVVAWLYRFGPWAVVAAAGLVAAYFLFRYYRQMRQPPEGSGGGNGGGDGSALPPVSVLELAANEKLADGTAVGQAF
jgi:membrane protein DedA with SNARE-associated domain